MEDLKMEDLKGITFEDKPLENFIEQKEVEKKDKEIKEDIKEKIHKTPEIKTKVRMRAQRASNPTKGDPVIEITDDDKRQFLEIHKEDGIQPAIFFLFWRGYVLSSRDLQQIFPEIAKSTISRIFTVLPKTQVRQLMERKNRGNVNYYHLLNDYLTIDYRDLYHIFSPRFPETLRNLEKKYPELFDTSKGDDFLEDDFEKCPNCQQKSYSQVANACVACSYTTQNDDPVEELEKQVTDREDDHPEMLCKTCGKETFREVDSKNGIGFCNNCSNTQNEIENKVLSPSEKLINTLKDEIKIQLGFEREANINIKVDVNIKFGFDKG